jgi:flagellar protein FliS
MNASSEPALKAYKQVQTEVATETANPHTLISMLLTAITDRLCDAERSFATNDLKQRGEQVSKAQTILFSLRSTLDFDQGGELARMLDSLYDYCIRQLSQAHIDNDVVPVLEVKGLIGQIGDAWNTIPKNLQAK